MSIRNPRRKTPVGLIIFILSIVVSFYLIPNHFVPWYESRYQMTSGAFRKLQDEGLSARLEGRYEDAERLMLESLNYAISTYGSDHLKVAEISYHLATLYEQLEKYQIARQYFNQSIAISTKQYRLPPRMTEIQILRRISITSLEHGEYDTAIEYAKRTIGAIESSRPKDNTLLLDALFVMAETYEEQQNQLREEVMRKRIVTINEELVGNAELALIKSLHRYGALLYSMKKYNEAKDAVQQCQVIADKYRDATSEEFQEMLKIYHKALDPTEKSKKEQKLPG